MRMVVPFLASLFGVLVGVLLCTLLGVPVGLGSARSLTVHELHVVNDSGAELVALGAGQEGGGMLMVRNPEGGGVVVLRVDNDSHSGVVDVWNYKTQIRRALEAK